ncbi:class I SAM-dependent methyltransferase [Nonomuraea sp. B19D2]|uniref:class I SAM-dependent methyltransferase n=1 Tax=Nonomuraea sp. B19D2 TaxID=3159561 RepID=UPI0032DBA61C
METIRGVLSRLAERPALEYGAEVWTGADLLRLIEREPSEPWDEGTPAAVLAMVDGLADGPDDGDPSTILTALGDAPARVAVLAPPRGFGGDAMLASWIAGASVVYGPGPWTPARALAFLERTAADRAVLSAALARALPAQPAAAMTDLSALTRIICGPGPITDAETRSVRETFAVELVMTALPQAEDDVRKLVGDTAAAADRELRGIDVDAALAALDRLGRTALLSMLNALSRRGLFTAPGDRYTADEIAIRTSVIPRYERLLRRWLAVLTEEGLLSSDVGGLRAVPAAAEYTDATIERTWREVEQAWQAPMGASGTAEYARRSAERLPELLSGHCHAVGLLFPEGRMDLAESQYRENLAGRYQHRAAAALLGGIAARWRERRPLRVLEVGAGTGATTERILPALEEADVDYFYTDISAYFVDQAAERLRAYPWVRFGRYDIDLEPDVQGFTPGSFDVVIGGGVLNAAQDTDASVRHLARLLDPGGWLVLTEPTVEQPWVLITQAFLMADARDDRAGAGTTFLSLAQWHDVLDRAGLERVATLPEAGHPLARLGHMLFAARTT